MHKKKLIDLERFRSDDADGDVDALEPGTGLLFGQYTILQAINAGGFGITYLAKDSLDRHVAIKECYPGELCVRAGNDMRARTEAFEPDVDIVLDHFLTEAHRLSALQHESVVHVHQIFEENDTAYMVMDFIDGADLLDVATGAAGVVSLSPAQIEAMTKTVLHAVAYVHGQGILHRDLAPDNIMMGKDNAPVLIDFGTARPISDGAAERPTRLKFVKDGYSPQEFYSAGGEQSPSSDLYALGATLYHVISGAAPVDAETRLAALMAERADPCVPLVDRFDGYSDGFLDAVDTALRVMPDNRIQTAQDWLALIPFVPQTRETFGFESLAGENMITTLIPKIAANTSRWIKGAVASFAALAVVAVGLIGFNAQDGDPILAHVPVVNSAAPGQPVTVTPPLETEPTLAAIQSVDKVVLAWVPDYGPMVEDTALAAMDGTDPLTIVAPDTPKAAFMYPEAEYTADIVAPDITSPDRVALARLSRPAGILNQRASLVDQSPSGLGLLTAKTISQNGDDITSTSRFKPLGALTPDRQIVTIGRQAPLPGVTLVSSFGGPAAAPLPTNPRVTWAKDTTVPVLSRGRALPVIFSERLFDGDVTAPRQINTQTPGVRRFDE